MLKPELLIEAYRRGIFPMVTGPRDEIAWFSPDPRAIIPLDEAFHIPHGLRRALKSGKFEITIDTDFDAVIHACAKRKDSTWISGEIIESYSELYRLGHAHSVESRLAGRSSADCTASTSAARSSAKACSTGRPMHRRLRS